MKLRLVGRAAHAAPFGRRRIVGHETGIRRTRKCTKSKLPVLADGHDGARPSRVRVVSCRGGAAFSCPVAFAAGRRLKRRGEARRRSFDLSGLLQTIVLPFDLQAVRRRGVSRGGAAPQSDGLSWSRVSASPYFPFAGTSGVRPMVSKLNEKLRAVLLSLPLR